MPITTFLSFQNVVLFSYSGSKYRRCSKEKERTDLKGSIFILSITFSPLQLQRNIVFSVPTAVSILTACTGETWKKGKCHASCCSLLSLRECVRECVKECCCMKTLKSREPVNVMCSPARFLLSDTLHHVTAVLD